MTTDANLQDRIAALEAENSSLRIAVGLTEAWTRQRDAAKRRMAGILGLAEDVTIGEVLTAAQRIAERNGTLEAALREALDRWAPMGSEKAERLLAVANGTVPG